MDFNPYPKKQATEVCFSRKILSNYPSPLSFNQSQVKISESLKHLGFILDPKFKFNEHHEDKISNCNRIIASIKKLLRRTCLLAIYKAFVRPRLDYADNIYEKLDHESLKDWLEKVQYNAALVLRDAIRGTSRERIYKELGLESPADRQWYRKMTFFYKIVKNLAPKYYAKLLITPSVA